MSLPLLFCHFVFVVLLFSCFVEHLILLDKLVSLASLLRANSEHFWYFCILWIHHLSNAFFITLHLSLQLFHSDLFLLTFQLWTYHFLQQLLVFFLHWIKLWTEEPSLFCCNFVFLFKNLYLPVTFVFIECQITNCFEQLVSF